MSRASAKRAAEGTASRARVETVWTAELVRRVCERHREGAFLNTACAAERVSYEGLRDALARHPEWRLDVDEAHAAWEQVLLERIRTLEGEPARAARWELERWSRETFAPPKQQVESKNEHTTPAGGPIQILVASTDELRQLAAPKPIAEEDP